VKVLNIMSRFNVGGTSQWLYNLSQGLDEKGLENLLVIGDCPNGEHEDERLSLINHLKIEGLGPGASVSSTLTAFFQVRRAIKRFGPDIINTHTSKAGVIGRLAAKSTLKRRKVVHTYHGHVLSGYFSKPVETLIRYVEMTLRFCTDLYFVSGQRVMDEIVKAKILGSKPVLTVWPAVPDFKLGSRESLRKSLGIPSDAFVVGWLGRKVPIKRIDRILELAQSNPDFFFIVAGDGPRVRETYASKFDGGQLKNFIELGISNPSEIWTVSDVCLLTSDNEAMPISPIEASLSSKPVVATDAGSTSEVVKNSETGFLCGMEVQALKAAIKRLADDRNLRMSMGSRAREFALEKFSPQASVARQIEGYRSALGI